MAQPTEVYVDPSIAGNSGTGTIGDPYGDLQYGLNTVSRDSTNGNRFNIKSGTDEVLTAILSLATYGTPTLDAPLIFQGYTSSAGDGGIGGINGNNGNHAIIGSGTGIHFADLNLHNTGTATPITLAVRGSLFRCHIYNTSSNGVSGVGAETLVEDCSFTDIGAVGVHVTGVGARIANNYFANGTKSFTKAIGCSGAIVTDLEIVRNIISISGSSKGIALDAAQARGRIIHNSILSSSGTGVGIDVNSNGSIMSSVANNIVEGFSGAGGVGIRFVSPGRNAFFFGHNAVFNCTTNYSNGATGEIIHLVGDNESLGSSGFAKSGSNNYSNRGIYFAPNNVGNIFGGAYPSIARLDKGAVQRIVTSSSSGGGIKLVGFGGLV